MVRKGRRRGFCDSGKGSGRPGAKKRLLGRLIGSAGNRGALTRRRAGRGRSMGRTWRATGTVELGLAGAAGQRGDLGQRYEFRGQMPRLDSNLEIYIAIKRLVWALAQS